MIIFNQDYGGLTITILANLGQLTRDIYRADKRVSGNLIRLRNRFKLVQGAYMP